MHSNWYPWDFFKTQPTVVNFDIQGVYAISVFDPFIESLVNHKLKKNHRFKIVLGSELDIGWFESNLSTMDLFSTNGGDSYLVVRPEDMPNEVGESLLNGSIVVNDRFFIMVYSSANKVFDKMTKSDHVQTLKMDPPRFWESGKHLNFLAREMGVPLNTELENYILGAIPNTTADFVHALRTIRLDSIANEKLSLRRVQELIVKTKMDQFALASLFGKKDKKTFFKTLAHLEMDFDSLRSLFGFMQGHLAKILDPGYVRRKARPSKYDREIEMHSKLWDKGELVKEIHRFSRLELDAKRRDLLLKNRLRQIYLGLY